MHTDDTIFKKMLANWIQYYIERIIHHDQKIKKPSHLQLH